MLITPSFNKRLVVEQFQGKYLKRNFYKETKGDPILILSLSCTSVEVGAEGLLGGGGGGGGGVCSCPLIINFSFH